MDRQKAKEIFDVIYKDVNGYNLSLKGQQKLNYFYNANVYGEVDFESFCKILDLTNPKENEIFYDLGSGTGKAVIIAYLCYPFAKCIGVEKMDELYFASDDIAKSLNNPRLGFKHGDFKDCDFSDGDVIYMNSYYFHYEMASKNFISKINNLKKGTRIIFVMTPLTLPAFEIIHFDSYKFSWGNAPVYISVKME